MQISFGEVINQLLVMALIISIGYATKKTGIFNENSDKTLSRLVVNITAPALIVLSLSSSPEYLVLENVFVVGVLTICIVSFSYLLSRLIVKVGNFTSSESTIYRFSAVFGNATFLGFPLCYGLFGDIGLLYASVYSAVQDIFFWSVGVNLMADSSKRGSKIKNLLNPNMIAIFAGIIMLVFRVKLPVFLEDTFTTVGRVTIPVALMMVGSGFYNAKIDAAGFKSILLPGTLKLAVIPAVVGIVLHFVNIDITVKYVLLLQLAMPTAASTVVLARNYGQDYVLASKVVAVTTGFSLVTLMAVVFAAGILF